MIFLIILFVYNIFHIFEYRFFFPRALQISSPEVSVIAFTNFSLKCLVGVTPWACHNKLQWRFSNSSTPLKSCEKYEIQERKTKTKCKTEFIITIFNVTYPDEGRYSSHWFCFKSYPSFGITQHSLIQLRVFPLITGMNNRVLISSALQKVFE